MSGDVVVYDHVIEAAFCDHVISLFEADESKLASARYAFSRGKIAAPMIEIPEQISAERRGRVAVCGSGPGWDAVRQRLSKTAAEAMTRFAGTHPGIASLCEERFVLTVPRIEKICEGDGFEWHMDSRHVQDDRRFLTFVFYLNDVHEGGETELFNTGEKVRPRAGRLLMLPPFWTHLHTGRTPIGQTKYTASMFAARSD